MQLAEPWMLPHPMLCRAAVAMLRQQMLFVDELFDSGVLLVGLLSCVAATRRTLLGFTTTNIPPQMLHQA